MKRTYQNPEVILTPMMPCATILSGSNVPVSPDPVPGGEGGD